MRPTQPTVVAFYLPQYHPIPENDEWWGKGFTEWTNVTKAKPLYRGHQQPDLPADLGFYDLRLPEARAAQADLARAHGIGAFCYYHYWFGDGRRILERPFDEVLSSGQPDFPFMLCWANQSWAGVWHGLDPGRVLIEQRYPGEDDHRAHFQMLCRAFRDRRYLRVEGRPVFMIYNPDEIPDLSATAALYRQMASAAGLPGLYLIAESRSPKWPAQSLGFDAFVNVPRLRRRRESVPWYRPISKIKGKLLDLAKRPTVIPYATEASRMVSKRASDAAIPCVLPNWDNTPRAGYKGMVMQGSTPELFKEVFRAALARAHGRKSPDNLVFIKSWNEWAEGNHLEPCLRFGRGYLDALSAVLSESGRGV
jgi:hypothetical protein